MTEVRYIILGAGPAGLTTANRLLDLGETSFLVLEKESEAGGLCRSREVDGAPLDIGGGHFLDTKRAAVVDYLFRFLPREHWLEYDRLSTIRVHDREISYPFEANLWQLPAELQVDYLESIARAGCNTGLAMPADFEGWIRWKLGDRIAEDYMLPYNRKIWSIDVSRLGTYWLHKLPNVSFRDTLLSCIEGRPSGTLPAHARFFYPKAGGYGVVWRLMAERLAERLLLDTPLTCLDVGERVVNGTLRAVERVITTIPWPELATAAVLPPAVATGVGCLAHAAIEVAYQAEVPTGPAHWTYVPAESVAHHRVLNRGTFCPGARGYWTETNVARAGRPAPWRHVNEYAYPLNTRAKPEALATVLAWASERGLTGLGRWGQWEHMNSDAAVEAGIALADALAAPGGAANKTAKRQPTAHDHPQ